MCYFHICSGDTHDSHHPLVFCRAQIQHRAVDEGGLERGCRGRTYPSRKPLPAGLGAWGERGALGRAQWMAGPGLWGRESPDLQLAWAWKGAAKGEGKLPELLSLSEAGCSPKPRAARAAATCLPSSALPRPATSLPCTWGFRCPQSLPMGRGGGIAPHTASPPFPRESCGML